MTVVEIAVGKLMFSLKKLNKMNPDKHFNVYKFFVSDLHLVFELGVTLNAMDKYISHTFSKYFLQAKIVFTLELSMQLNP